ncbi:hypothetical protein NQ156_11240 [Microbacterium sp. zg.Y625]|uniref:hypothetical protein n=1 Tax=Microbacterium jiangjiandongii TaxID=3049071 RepID=UPI00214C4ED1|nr:MULTISPECIES: hypothetical protein [unclassified Microbacterium]MCR2793637.1 hypothetical protein [Microbacterium sp. zg.Y625]MCR2815759.1 hypothetical protein [Microbacterium sp. zg.Y843]WIM25986.1 hypothetical protein QNO14_02725 [Microbacterium sp. zg-Y625]
MSGRLRIDIDEVGRVSTNLATIVRRLESAQADASSLAGAIPVTELANATDDFAGKWDDKRRQLIEEVTALKEQAHAVAEAFTEIDSQLVDALTRSPEPAGGPGRGGPQAV